MSKEGFGTLCSKQEVKYAAIKYPALNELVTQVY